MKPVINVGDLEHAVAVARHAAATLHGGYTHAKFIPPPAKQTRFDAPKSVGPDDEARWNAQGERDVEIAQRSHDSLARARRDADDIRAGGTGLNASQLSELRWRAAEHISARLRELGFHTRAIGLDSMDELADASPEWIAELIKKAESFT